MGAGVLRHFHAPSDITYKWTPDENILDVESSHTYVVPTQPTTYNFTISRESGCVVSDDIFINIEDYGVDDKSNNKASYLIYPIPVSDMLYITSKKEFKPGYYVKIYNATGVVLFEDVKSSGNDREYSIKPKFEPGLYFIAVTDSDGTYLRKVIIQ